MPRRYLTDKYLKHKRGAQTSDADLLQSRATLEEALNEHREEALTTEDEAAAEQPPLLN